MAVFNLHEATHPEAMMKKEIFFKEKKNNSRRLVEWKDGKLLSIYILFKDFFI